MSDLPGFYRDPETGKYFRVLPGMTLPNDKRPKEKLKVVKKQYMKTPVQIVSAIARQQEGFTIDINLNEEVKKSTLGKLSRVSLGGFPVMANNILASCQYVVCYDDCCLCAWDLYGGVRLGTVIFHLSQKSGSSIVDYSMVENVVSYHAADVRNASVVDMCKVNFGDNKLFALAVNDYNYSHVQLVSRTAVSYSNFSPFYNANIMFKSAIRSCAFNNHKVSIAIGTERGLMLHNIERHRTNFIGKRSSQMDYFSLDFNSSGDYIYCGLRHGILEVMDFRQKYAQCSIQLGQVISYVKSIDDNAVLASCYENKLCYIDMRMKRVVHLYEGHVNEHRKIPLMINESWDILCSPGQDNTVRFWSLKRGTPLRSIESSSLHPESVYKPGKLSRCQYQTFAGFQSHRNRIFAYLFVEGNVHIYEDVSQI